MALELVLPSRTYEHSYNGYIVELGDEDRYPFPLDFAHHVFVALLQRLADIARGVNIPQGFVPSSTFWLIEDGELVGVSNLRHYLNARIRHCGGHIGVGIRPSCRGRGLGSELMALTIQVARQRSIDAIHLHCHKENAASARMIVSNGGLLHSEVADGPNQDIVQRYVVAPTVQDTVACD